MESTLSRSALDDRRPPLVRTDRMQVVELAGPGDLRLSTRPIPATPADGVLLRTRAVSICSTDVSFFDGHLFPDDYPVVLGHEYVGVVVDRGPEIAERGTVCVGDRLVYWGQTDFDGLAEYRSVRPVFAGERKTDPFPAERSFVDDRRAAAVVVPSSLPDIGASLIEPTTGVLRSILGNPPAVGDRVLILGAGPIGIIAGSVLRKTFAVSEVVVLDQNLARNARAAAIVADRAVTPAELADIPDDYFDYVFDGLPTIRVDDDELDPRRQAMRRLRPNGRYVLYGASQEMQKFDTWLLLAKGIKMVSVPFDVRAFPMHRSAVVMRTALAAISSGVVDIDSLITRVHPFADFEGLRTIFAEYRTTSDLKIVIDFSG
ncbi:alcohol dehydrogenase catalytic domain-containing protein [Rathayibacter rathayi]|nr:alcohol dehydrogenase catalytic domain-containing protein [Rathayibacter rathayi]